MTANSERGAWVERSRPPRIAAAILAAVGCLLLIPGVLMIVGGLVAHVGQDRTCQGIACGVPELLAILGGILVALGAAHAVPVVGVWSQRRWGRWLGGAVAGLGLAIGVVGLGLAVADGLDLGMLLLWAPVVAAYGIVLVGLVRWYPPDRGTA